MMTRNPYSVENDEFSSHEENGTSNNNNNNNNKNVRKPRSLMNLKSSYPSSIPRRSNSMDRNKPPKPTLSSLDTFPFHGKKGGEGEAFGSNQRNYDRNIPSSKEDQTSSFYRIPTEDDKKIGLKEHKKITKNNSDSHEAKLAKSSSHVKSLDDEKASYLLSKYSSGLLKKTIEKNSNSYKFNFDFNNNDHSNTNNNNQTLNKPTQSSFNYSFGSNNPETKSLNPNINIKAGSGLSKTHHSNSRLKYPISFNKRRSTTTLSSSSISDINSQEESIDDIISKYEKFKEQQQERLRFQREQQEKLRSIGIEEIMKSRAQSSLPKKEEDTPMILSESEMTSPTSTSTSPSSPSLPSSSSSPSPKKSSNGSPLPLDKKNILTTSYIPTSVVYNKNSNNSNSNNSNNNQRHPHTHRLSSPFSTSPASSSPVSSQFKENSPKNKSVSAVLFPSKEKESHPNENDDNSTSIDSPDKMDDNEKTIDDKTILNTFTVAFDNISSLSTKIDLLTEIIDKNEEKQQQQYSSDMNQINFELFDIKQKVGLSMKRLQQEMDPILKVLKDQHGNSHKEDHGDTTFEGDNNKKEREMKAGKERKEGKEEKEEEKEKKVKTDRGVENSSSSLIKSDKMKTEILLEQEALKAKNENLQQELMIIKSQYINLSNENQILKKRIDIISKKLPYLLFFNLIFFGGIVFLLFQGLPAAQKEEIYRVGLQSKNYLLYHLQTGVRFLYRLWYYFISFLNNDPYYG